MTSTSHTTGNSIDTEQNPQADAPPKRKPTRSLADHLAGQAEVDDKSVRAEQRVTPGQYLVNRFPSLAKKYGTPLAEAYLGRGDDQRLITKAIEDGFFAAYLGIEGCPDAPAVYDHSSAKFYLYYDGWYRETTAEVLEEKLRNLLLKAERACTDSNLDNTGLKRLRGHRSLSAVVQAAKGVLLVRDEFWKRQPAQIPCKNGVLEWDDFGEILRLHSPQYHFRGLLNADYNPKAACPRFTQLLDRALPSEDVELLQRVLGSVLLGRNIAQKLAILSGTPSSGKGVIARTVIGLIGPENVTTLRTNSLDGRFEVGRYMNKLLLYAPDVSERFLHERGAHLLKAITGEDPMSPEYKNSNVTPPSKPCDAHLLITCNSHLKVHLEGDRGAWERRLIVVPFEREGVTEQKQITGLSEMLIQEEGAGILNWMLDGFEAFVCDDFKLRLNNRQRAVVYDLLSESESCTCFVRECVVKEDGTVLLTDSAYPPYVRFCSSREWSPLSKRKFEQDFKAAILKVYGITQGHDLPGKGGRDARGWRGIMLCEPGM
jgi:putative DNA primase/helicase